MALVAVPTGSTSSVSLSFANTATASLATSLLASVYEAAAENILIVYPQPIVEGSPGNYIAPTAEYVVTVAGAVTVPAGYNVIVDAVTTGTPTITGNGGTGELFIAGDGSFYYIPTGGSGTVVAGAGNDSFAEPAYQIGNGYTFLGDSALLSVSGDSTLVETINHSGTYTYSEVNGFAPTFYLITNTAPGPTTVNLNAYSETVSALSNGGVYNDNSYMTFINGGANTVLASASAKYAEIFGGNYNMMFAQGAGLFNAHQSPTFGVAV